MNTVKFHILAWCKVTIILWAAYMLYDYVRYSITGISSHIAVQIGEAGGQLFAIWFFWGVVPFYLIKGIMKLCRSIASVVSPSLPGSR